jgi:hypothetical protein
MDTKLFWQLLKDVCQLGEFIITMEIKAAQINIRGMLQLGYDHEMVLERQDCHDHVHITPEQIQKICFGYCPVGTGRMDPCIELINVDGQVCLRLFYYPYRYEELKPKYEQFISQHTSYKEILTGEW